jgi:peptidoglycan/xylan/chitin deacetylase (PgdA/CDA1 family)
MFSMVSAELYRGLGGLAALGLVAGYIYGSRSPASQIFGRTLIAPPRPTELALTFDDGPNPAWTPYVLDILARRGVHATFFLVGKYADSEKALVRRIVESGHLIGNHSWSHPNLSLATGGRVRDELRRTSDMLEQIIGQPVRYFRPPYGARRPVVLRAARRLGMKPVMWNVMTNDWKEPSGEQISQRLINKIDRVNARGSAANIVLHDGSHARQMANRGPSTAAAGQIIENYKSTHRFVTFDDWA